MKRFMRKQLPALLLVLVMLVGMVPAAAAASADFSYTVKAGKEVKLDRADFKDYFEDECDHKDFTCLVFDDAGKLDSYGKFTAENKAGKKVSLDADDLDGAFFYYKASEMDDECDYDLNTLKFVADDDTKKDVTLSMDITLYNDDWDVEEECTLEIKISKAGSSSSSSSGGDIELKVDPGKEITIDRKKFKTLFEKEYDNFSYLRFTDVDNLTGNGNFYAYDYDEDEMKLSESVLKSGFFYYSAVDMYEDDYELNGMSFTASKNADGEVVTLDFTLYGKSSKDKMTGTLTIAIGDVDEDDDDDDVDADIVYKLDEDDEVSFDRKDFLELFEDKYKDEDLIYVTFSDIENLSDTGSLYATNYDDDDVYLTESEIEDGRFYYSGVDMDDEEGYYELNSVVFESDDGTDGETITMDFTAYGKVKSKKVTGTVAILIGEAASSSKNDKDDDDDDDADIIYEVEADDEVSFDRKDFKELFEDKYKNLSYVVFTDVDNLDDTGKLYALNYDEEETRIKESALEDAYFYYSSSDVEDEDYDYELDGITFKSAKDTDGETVTLEFTMYGKSSKDKMNGVLLIKIGDDASASTGIDGKGSGDIRYSTTYATSVQLNANHFARFLKAKFPSSSLQYVKITGVPSAGSVYYDYFNTSDYGEKVRLTSDNCDDYKFYFSPKSDDDYALTELSFIPNGFNYCPTISFTAYGSGSKSVSGEILISVTLNKIPDVYGVTPKGTTVKFPATSINSAVNTGTGAGVGSIRLLSLPSASQGTVSLTNGLKADTKTLYTYSTSGNYAISSLQFVPAANFTGNVEIPYVAYNASGNAVGSGVFSLGVVKSVPKFKDVNSATWCYKYVAEMSDAGVIGGYSDGTYRPNNALTYGAALKLIMLAAGYEKQVEPAGNTFGNYLALAKREGIVSGNPNLGGSITRLQVAQIAAKAMDLDTDDLSSVKPFTDTSDKYVQALSAAGIVEGYFSNGTSTFKGGNTLTRGHISAIVWRMENYKG